MIRQQIMKCENETNQLSLIRKASNVAGLTRENPALDPIAVQNLENRLYMMFPKKRVGAGELVFI